MADFKTRLTRTALVAGRIENAPGVDPGVNPAFDAIEVSEPSWTPDIAQLERAIVSGSLSNEASRIGAKRASMAFTVEAKGNGRQNSGQLADQPLLARFFQACGFSLAALAAATTLDPIPALGNAPGQSNVAWAVAAPNAFLKPVLYRVLVTTGGASGVAKVSVSSNDRLVDDTSDDAEQPFTSGQAVNLGTSGAKVTPTITGTVAAGSSWSVLVVPKGLVLKPLTRDIATLSLQMYRDGQRHDMHAALGTFKVTSASGDVAKIEFTFSGTYEKPVDAATPVLAYPEGGIQPPLVELSNLTWSGTTQLVAQQWTFDMANGVVPRPDVNSKEGIKGYRITSRKPVGGFNPEATLNAEYDFWDELERGVCQPFFVKVGQVPGNTTVLFVPRAQLSALPYGDRDGTLTFDASFTAAKVNGDDEAYLVLC